MNDNDRLEGFVELVCKECGCAFEIYHPAYDLLMYPLCSSCQHDDDTYPLSRAD